MSELREYVPTPYHKKYDINDIAGFAFGQALQDRPRWHKTDDWIKALVLSEIRHQFDIPERTALAFNRWDIVFMAPDDIYVDCKFSIYPFDDPRLEDEHDGSSREDSESQDHRV